MRATVVAIGNMSRICPKEYFPGSKVGFRFLVLTCYISGGIKDENSNGLEIEKLLKKLKTSFSVSLIWLNLNI